MKLAYRGIQTARLKSHIMCRSCALVVLAAMMWIGPVFAQQNFFKASVPVTSQSPGDRKAAAQLAFAEVITRISGSDLVLDNSQMNSAHSNAIAYVEQFQYSPVDDPKLLAQGYKEQIALTFSAVSIERLLRKNNQPFWPVNRPTTLVWLVENDFEYGKQLVSGDMAPELAEGFEEAASLRGLPLSYPLLDIQDQVNLSSDQLWMLDEQAILQASERYSPDSILVGRYSVTSTGEVLSTWQFFHRGDSRVYDSRNQNLEQLGAAALNPLGDYLGGRYAILAQGENSSALVLQIAGVNSYSSYRKALDYLDSIAATSGVFLAGVRQDTLLLYLDSDAGVEKFVSVLALDGRLKKNESVAAGDLPVWQQAQRGSLENPLQYRWGR
ncbi:DUF2066 domain-containing protein [Teredinibacter haidensis]|uniref:DUF2066 domain-containing protein n=1 Tax=Teredinibacter haidensis TaxID=2731755 RepID=UPI000A6B09FA|nr:DUF2066 domain-containing protein [Teredinibacter haidensis]